MFRSILSLLVVFGLLTGQSAIAPQAYAGSSGEHQAAQNANSHVHSGKPASAHPHHHKGGKHPHKGGHSPHRKGKGKGKPAGS